MNANEKAIHLLKEIEMAYQFSIGAFNAALKDFGVEVAVTEYSTHAIRAERMLKYIHPLIERISVGHPANKEIQTTIDFINRVSDNRFGVNNLTIELKHILTTIRFML